jgi:hypothetical protein
MTVTRKWLAIGVLGGLLAGMAQPARAQEELAALGAGVEAIKKIYAAYKTMLDILQSGDPTPEDKIIAQLTTIQTEMQKIDAQLQALDRDMENLVYMENRGLYLDLLRDAQTNEALAQSASDLLREWQQTGKTDHGKLLDAARDSLIAANTLMKEGFYLRPGSDASKPDVFEYRTTLPRYLYALTVRLGVVAVEQPQFRKFSAYTDEFKAHVAWLKQIPGRMEANVSCKNAPQISAGYAGIYYAIYSYCVDNVSGIETGAKPNPSPGNQYITSWTLGSPADIDSAFSYYTFYTHWQLQDKIGEYTVQQILPSVVFAATPWSPSEVQNSTFGASGPQNGPLSNNARCLADPGNGFTIASCNSQSPTQQWTATRGVAAPISETNPFLLPDACIEVDEWKASSMVYPERCSGSPGEQWILTNANEIRWGRDTSLCLQNDFHLRTCNGSASQKWYRNWPSVYVAPGPIYVPVH